MQNVSFCRWEKCLFLTCFFIDDDGRKEHRVDARVMTL